MFIFKCLLSDKEKVIPAKKIHELLYYKLHIHLHTKIVTNSYEVQILPIYPIHCLTYIAFYLLNPSNLSYNLNMVLFKPLDDNNHLLLFDNRQ